jgi:hypothetical protein
MLSSLESLTSPDFWSDQIAAALKAWAILIPTCLVFWAALKITLAKANKEIKALKTYTEAVESRLQLARDLNAGGANDLAALRAEIDALRRLTKTKGKSRKKDTGDAPDVDKGSKGQPSVVEATLKQVDASVASLAMANSTTDHILTAKVLSIGDLEKKQNLKLGPRPNLTGRTG